MIQPICNSEDYDNFIVKIDNKYGIIDEEGETIAPAVFDEIVENFKSPYLEVTFRGKKGLVTQSGDILVPLAYDDVYVFGDNTFGVKKDGKWQIVDHKNKPKNPYFYDDIQEHVNRIVIAVLQDDKWGFIYFNGEEASSLRVDGFAWEYPFVLIEINGKWGALKVLSHQVEEVLPVEYDRIEVEPYSIQKRGAGDELDSIDPADRIVPPIYDYLRKYLQADDMLVPPIYDYMGNCHREYAEKIIGKKEGADDSVYIPNRYIKIKKNNQWGIFDASGNEKVPAMYEAFGFADDFEDIIPACLNGKWGYINTENKIISPFIYDEADIFRLNNFAKVTMGNKQGLIDRKGNIIYPLECEWIWILDTDLVRIKQNGEFFHIDPTGKVIERYDKNALVNVAAMLKNLE